LGKKLIITEKPSVAQDYAKVFNVSGRQNGYIENDTYVITWCVGHLVEMVYPEEYDIKYKKWMLEDLPFLPETYKYGVIKNVSQQYNIVNRLLHRDDIDTVYWAGDSGKEGQTIEENIRNYGGVREGMRELRVWIDSQTEEEIRRGVNEAKPMSDYANLGSSGIMRSIEDYAMGINFSRVMSVKYGNMLNGAAATKSYTAIAVGRVMTCVLGMVVNREREIRSFKETPYYRVVGSFSDAELEAEWRSVDGSAYFESPKLYKENGFKEKTDAEALIASLEGKSAVIKTLEKGVSKKKAPLLFNLAELQAECSKRFKISPDETLQVAQDLYEKKLTTYPRTDARVLTKAVGKEIVKNLSKLQGYSGTQKFVGNILENKLYENLAKTQYVDDSKVTDHYAIIPTGQLTELKGLNPLQSKVFELIVRRFLSIFYPPAEYQTLKLVIGVGGENLFASAKVLKSLGYMEVMGKTEVEANNTDKSGGEGETTVKNSGKLLKLADTLKQGDNITINGYDIKESKTSPPKRYTSGSMILAMENAGQLIEDDELRAQIKGSGIGTSATRAEIIKKLIRIGYLNLNQKTQVITPMNFGEMVYEVVNMTVPSLLNPQMTASWEKGLDGITNGTVDMAVYRSKIEDYIRRETNHIKDTDLAIPIANKIREFAVKGSTGLAAARKKVGGACPLCGGDVIETPFGYGCSKYSKDDPENSCRFAISGKIAGVKMTGKIVKTLLADKKTDVIKGFTSKGGTKFDAPLKINDEGQVVFDFPERQKPIQTEVVCPRCKVEKLSKSQWYYECKCGFKVGHTVAQVPLSEEIINELFETGHTKQKVTGFVSKAGRGFDAFLKYEEEKILFDFDNAANVANTEKKDDVKSGNGGENGGENPLPWV
jgi:DNA topoisomerase-3